MEQETGIKSVMDNATFGKNTELYVHPLYHWPPKVEWQHSEISRYHWNRSSLYLHVPFCRHICDFCGFEKRIYDAALIQKFGKKASEQILSIFNYNVQQSQPLRSVYFGGGTASLLPATCLQSILSIVADHTTEKTEVTLESEPGTLDKQSLKEAKDFGVNRISVGLQSTHDNILQRLGRKHKTYHSLRLIESTITAGINNIHVDLIYGILDQTLTEWQTTLMEIVKLPVTHISVYKLFVFTNGALHRSNPQYKEYANSSFLEVMHNMAQEILEEHGFFQYSLTEYAKIGFESEYIKNFFDGDDIIGVGPGAFGRCSEILWENSPFVSSYIQSGNGFNGIYYNMSKLEAFKRDIILGLWLLRVDINALATRYSIAISEDLLELIGDLMLEDILNFNNGQIHVGKHQRYHIGKAMVRLADLETSKFGNIKK